MKFVILSIILILCSCYMPPPIELYQKIDNGAYLHQCQDNIFFAVDKSVPEELRPVVLSAFNYWNNLYSGNLFFYIGEITDQEILNSRSMVVVQVVERGPKHIDKALASTYIGYIYNKDGCMPNPIIKIREDALIYTDYVVESVIRHEIGHILGFKDSYFTGHLMNKHIGMFEWTEKAKEASEWEIEAFKIYYKK